MYCAAVIIRRWEELAAPRHRGSRPHRGRRQVGRSTQGNSAGPALAKAVTYVAAELGRWADTVQEHFTAWNPAVPLVEWLGRPSDHRLSTGEKQRLGLGLVRALMLGSRVLLLDEPTSALDARSTAIVEANVAERISTGTSVIWSTHDSAQARRVGSRSASNPK
jgi:UDP-glucose/iron transport system ATP-binding protein